MSSNPYLGESGYINVYLGEDLYSASHLLTSINQIECLFQSYGDSSANLITYNTGEHKIIVKVGESLLLHENAVPQRASQTFSSNSDKKSVHNF